MSNDTKSRWPGRLLIVAVLAAALGGAAWYFNADHTPPIQYQTAAATRGDLVQAVTANGQLSPLLNVQVGSQISGIINQLFADWNSLVKSNQIVAQLDPATYLASVHSAEGDLANAKANLELQQIQEARSATLLKDRLIPQSDYDTAVANLHQAQAQVKVREASLERAKVDLSRCTIYAPVDGIVISRNVDVGQTVAASMNAPVLFNIANDLSKMQIDANVAEADVGTIVEGQDVTFKVDAYPERQFVGKVAQIRNSPTTVQNVVTYDTVINVDNKDLKLKPGMTATVSIITAQRTGVCKIPNAAFRFKPPEPQVSQTLLERLLAGVGLGKATKPATNSVPPAAAGTNMVAADGGAPLSVNDPPEELARRVREMRQRGEEPPPEISAKLMELIQSGVLQRPANGRGARAGAGGGAGGASDARPRSSAPAWRTVYLMATNTPPGGGEPVVAPVATRVRTGISDGSYTEVIEGLKEGAVLVTAVKSAQAATPVQAASSPFGGPGGGGRGRF
jgi:HlyD family secretion protein